MAPLRLGMSSLIWRGIGVALVVLVLSGACRTYEAAVHQDRPWPGSQQSLGPIALGHFRVRAERMEQRQSNLYDSLSFALREQRFAVLEAQPTLQLIRSASLRTDRRLRPDELTLCRNRMPGRLLLQGELQLVVTQDVIEDRLQAMLNVYVHDLTTGQTVATIKLFARDLPRHTGQESLKMARRVAREIRAISRRRGASPGG